MSRTEIPDRVGVLLGYRYWYLGEGELCGVGWTGDPWRLDGPTRARCLAPRWRAQEEVGVLPSNHPGEVSPVFSCSCGLHAYYPRRPHPVIGYNVWGAILAWGKIVHHKYKSFFRAEKALPIGFHWKRPTKSLLYVADSLAAPIFPRLEELSEYANEEVKRWT